MKRYKFIAVGCLMIFFASCTTEYNNAPVVGEWRLTAAMLGNAYDFNNDGTASKDLMAETGCWQNEYIYFDDDYFGEYRFNSQPEIEWNNTNNAYDVSCIEETEWPYFVWTYNNGKGSITWQGQGMWGFDFYHENNTITIILPEMLEVPVKTNSGNVVIKNEDLILVYEKI